MIDPAVLVPGVRVTFADEGVVSDKAVLTSGLVNGPVMAHNGAWFVPVWADRDNGRESGTVYVAGANVMAVNEEGSTA